MPQSPGQHGAQWSEPSSAGIASDNNDQSDDSDGLPRTATVVSSAFTFRASAAGRELMLSPVQGSSYPIDHVSKRETVAQLVLDTQVPPSAPSSGRPISRSNDDATQEQSSSCNDSRKRSRDQVEVRNVGEIGMHADKKSRQDTREETSLWTTVKNYLKDPDSSQEPAVSCCICYTEIAIRGLPSQSPCPWKLSAGWQKVGTTLPCAHIFCQECIRNHLQSQSESSQEPTCPICRLSLEHGFCGHTVAPKRIPVATTETAEIVPLTLLELPHGKKSLPEDCLPCLRKAVGRYIDTGLNCVINLIHGEGNPAERNIENNPTWASVVGHVHSVLRSYTDSQKTGAHWEYMSPSDHDLKIAFVDDACVATLAPQIRYAGHDRIISLHSADDQLMVSDKHTGSCLGLVHSCKCDGHGARVFRMSGRLSRSCSSVLPRYY